MKYVIIACDVSGSLIVRNEKTGGIERVWCSCHAVAEACTGPQQRNFERALRELGINEGCMTFVEGRYLNEHLQWLWTEYKK